MLSFFFLKLPNYCFSPCDALQVLAETVNNKHHPNFPKLLDKLYKVIQCEKNEKLCFTHFTIIHFYLQ